MKKNAVLLFGTFFLLVAMSSCTKEASFEQPVAGAGTGNGTGGGTNGGVNTTFIGKWNFIVMDAKTVSDQTATEPGITERTVSTTEYSTIDNKGLLTISNTRMDFTNFSYGVDAIIKAKYYVDGVFQDDLEAPFAAAIPTSNSGSEYKLIGSDSIYFPGGGFINIPGNPIVPSQESGATYKIEGNKLYIVSKYAGSSTQNIPNAPGSTLTAVNTAELKMTFQKQ